MFTKKDEAKAIELAERFIYDDSHMEKSDHDTLAYAREISAGIWEVAYDLAVVSFAPDEVKTEKDRETVIVDLNSKKVHSK